MAKITVVEFLSLDGVMETPEEWHFPFVNEEVQAEINAGIHGLDAVLLGRVTYDIFGAFWPTQTENQFGIADHLNSVPKYVVSNTLKQADWNNSTIISGDVIEGVSRLKQGFEGSIGINGSRTLAQSLMQAHLIDEYRLMIHPVVVGKGQRLFPEGCSLTLKLTETKLFSTGVIVLSYEPANAL